MRVKELIAELKRLDPEARVVVNMALNENANGLEVRNVLVGGAVRYKGEDPRAEWFPEEYFLQEVDDDMVGPEVVVNITSSEG